jgi:hypothetical protein
VVVFEESWILCVRFYLLFISFRLVSGAYLLIISFRLVSTRRTVSVAL